MGKSQTIEYGNFVRFYMLCTLRLPGKYNNLPGSKLIVKKISDLQSLSLDSSIMIYICIYSSVYIILFVLSGYCSNEYS